MTAFILPYSFIIGAMIGSFLTAWIWRERHGKSMLDKHSVCPQCRHPLGAIDLIPIISYAVQSGKCRYCHKKISAQYPLVELATALLFVSIALYLGGIGASWDAWMVACLLFLWAIIALLVALFVYDLKWYELPDVWTLGGSALAISMTAVAVIVNKPLLWQPLAGAESSLQDLFSCLASGVASAVFFYAIVWGSEKILKKPGMGLGDVKLGLFMGLFLGFPAIVIAIYLAFISGAVLSLTLIAGKQKSWGQALPFGPFLIAGTLLALWATEPIIAWYSQLWL